MAQQLSTSGGSRCQHCRPPTSCCRYAVLRSASMAISVVYLTLNIAGILGYALTLAYYGIVFPEDEMIKLYDMSYILIGVVLLGGINITFDILLLSGIRKAQRNLVLCWVVWYGIFTTVLTLGWLAGFIVFIYLVVENSRQLALGLFFTSVHCLLGLLILTMMWFCFSCVSSHLATLTPNDDKAMIARLVRQNTRFALVNLPLHEDSRKRHQEELDELKN